MVYLQAFGSIVLLVGFVFATTLLQAREIARALATLETSPEKVKATLFYSSAHKHFKRRDVADNIYFNRKSPQFIPAWFLVLVVFFCALIAYFGAFLFQDTTEPSYVLGGAYAVPPSIVPTDATSEQQHYRSYVSGTVFTGSMAFLSAYVWLIGCLVRRVNTDDMSPTTYYFLSARLLVACLVAAFARHMAEVVPFFHKSSSSDTFSDSFPLGMVILGFAIGWKPYLWLDELYDTAMKFLRRKRNVEQRSPSSNALASDMSLMMVQGLTEDKRDRLMELDIDNCQKLARDNPLIIWAKTSYGLELILDWVAQAQLCCLLPEEKVRKLGNHGLGNIFIYAEAAAAPDVTEDLAHILGIPPEIIRRHALSIANDESYRRLLELRQSLVP